MPKFKIFVEGTAIIHGHVFVEADSIEEAEKKALVSSSEDFNLDQCEVIYLKKASGRD